MIKRLKRASSEIFHILFNWTAELFQLLYGIWKLSKVPKPRVTFFGGSRLNLDDKYARDARHLARMCVDHEISVLTGGGHGIMEAGNCGVLDSKKAKNEQWTMGISMNISGEEAVNRCATNYNITLHYFFARKWLLIQYSKAFVVFPGGIGTLDELAEILTLMKTDKLQKSPVVLYDSNYWKIFLEWIDFALEKDLLTKQDKDLIIVSDSIDEIFKIIREQCDKRDGL